MKTNPGKSAPAVVKACSVKIVIPQFAQPKMKTPADSVAGARQDFLTVGHPATWSAPTKAIRATVGSWMKHHDTRPASAINPHVTSKTPILQTPLGFLNDARTTAKGTRPSIKVISDARPTCC